MVVRNWKKLVFLVLMSSQFLNPVLSENTEPNMKVTCSYPPQATKSNGVYISSHCAYPVALASSIIGANIRFLYTSMSNQPTAVSTAWFKPDGKTVLNPKVENPYVCLNYHDIPQLKDFTPALCDKLWKTPIASMGDNHTYKLISQKDKEESEFFIDVVFKDNRLSKYRVRTLAHETADWTTVQSAESNELFVVDR